MVNARELLYPNKFKITLFLLFAIPTTTLIIFLLDINVIYLNYNHFHSSLILVNVLLFLISIFQFIVLGLILSYVLGCFIDNSIQNEKIKITIAIVSGIVSLLIIYALYKMVTEPVICDPVHVPNQTICDPVHQPTQGESYGASGLNELKINKSAVENSLEQCIENLNN